MIVLEFPIIPYFWTFNQDEPYGFCKFPPWEKGEKPEEKWDPNKPENLPANIYSMSQYMKKASYYYPTSEAFKEDIEKDPGK